MISAGSGRIFLLPEFSDNSAVLISLLKLPIHDIRNIEYERPLPKELSALMPELKDEQIIELKQSPTPNPDNT